MKRLLLLATVLALAVASAENHNGTADELGAGDLVDDLLGEVGKAVDNVDPDAQGVLDEEEKPSSVTGVLGAAIRFVGTASLATVTVVAQAGALVSTGLSDAVVSSSAAMGSLGDVMAGSLAFLVGSIGSGLLAYGGLVQSMRPDAMPMAAFATVAAAGASTSAGAGGWAGFQALRKWGLIGTGAVAGFSRINDSELLDHPMRSQIFTVIKDHPGIHASQLAREMGVGWGTITHHLDKLQRASMVTTRKVNNQKCFFEQGGSVSRQDMAIASALKGDTASTIAQFALAHPMSSQKVMAEALGISPALASFHTKKLVNLGVLEKVRHGKETLLSTSDGLRRVLQSGDPTLAAMLQDSGFEYSS